MGRGEESVPRLDERHGKEGSSCPVPGTLSPPFRRDRRGVLQPAKPRGRGGDVPWRKEQQEAPSAVERAGEERLRPHKDSAAGRVGLQIQVGLHGDASVGGFLRAVELHLPRRRQPELQGGEHRAHPAEADGNLQQPWRLRPGKSRPYEAELAQGAAIVCEAGRRGTDGAHGRAGRLQEVQGRAQPKNEGIQQRSGATEENQRAGEKSQGTDENGRPRKIQAYTGTAQGIHEGT